jgi:hypothetical protein
MRAHEYQRDQAVLIPGYQSIYRHVVLIQLECSDHSSIRILILRSCNYTLSGGESNSGRTIIQLSSNRYLIPYLVG